MVCNDGFHGIIRRLEAVMAVFLVEGLDRGRIIDQGHDDIAVFCGRSGFNDQQVLIQDPQVDHAVALDFQTENLLRGVRKISCGNGKIAFNIFFSQNGLAGSYAPDYRDGNGGGPDHLKTLIQDLYGPGMGGIPPDIAVLFQRIQMGMHRRSRASADRFSDFSD